MKTKYLINQHKALKTERMETQISLCNINLDQFNLSSYDYLMSQMNKIFLMVTLFMYIVAVMVISKTVFEKYSVTLQNVIGKKVTNG